MKHKDYSYFLASESDLLDLSRLMELSTRVLQKPFLNNQQIEASFEAMGLDKELVRDQTYFKVLKGATLIGCGGWGKRKTLFGSSSTRNRNEDLLDPLKEPARIRAMYTHPKWTRKGVGRFILELSEEAASKEGFRKVELMATLAGEPLYERFGYEVVELIEWESSQGVIVPLKRMIKQL